MADEVVFNLIGDASSAVDAIDALVEAFSNLEDALNNIGAAVGELNAVVDAVAAVGDSATTLTESMAAVGDQTTAAMDIAAQATVPLQEALDQIPPAASAAAASFTDISDAATTVADSVAAVGAEGSAGIDELAATIASISPSLAGLADEISLIPPELAAVGEEGAASMDAATGSAQTLASAMAEIDAEIASFAAGLGMIGSEGGAALDQVSASADAAVTALDSTASAVASIAQGFDAIDVSALGLEAIFNDMADAGGAAMSGLAASTEDLNAALASVGTSAAEAAAAVKDYAASEGEAVAATNEAETSMDSGGFMAIMLAMGVLQAATSFTKLGMSAQDAISHIAGLADQSLAGAAGAQRLAQVMQTVDQYCLQFGISATDAANGLYFIMSAGFSTADSLKILKVSMEAAAATGTKMDTVSNALTSIMNAYGASADKAKNITNQMVQAVTSGKQTFQDFANSIGSVAQPAHSAGVGINEMLAAESTMTEVQPRVRQDTQNLAALFNYLAENQKKVTDAAKGIDPAFNANAFAAADLEGKLKMLNQAAAAHAKTSADVAFNMKALLGNMTNVKTATMIATDGYKMYDTKLKDINNSQKTLDVAFQESETTLTSSMNHINAALSIMAKNFVVAISPTIVPILDNIAQAMGNVATHANILMPVLAGLAVIIGGVLIVAVVALGAMFVGMIAPIMAIAGPIILIVAACVALGIAIVELNNRFHFIQAALDFFAPAVQSVGNGLQSLWHTFVQTLSTLLPFQAIMSVLGTLFHSLATTVMGTLVPALQQAWASIAAELIPAWQKLVAALQPVMQVLGFVAAILGGVLVVAIVVVVAILVGMVNALSAAIVGFGRLIAAVIQVATGIIEVFGGMWGIIVGIFTLNGALIQSSWNTLLDGLKNIAVGIWNAITAVFTAAFNGIIGLFKGFIGTIITAFTHLSDTLVGHSIVPDMMNAMVSSITSGLTRMVSAFINGLAQIIAHCEAAGNNLKNIFTNLASQAYTWGLDMMRQMANGVASAGQWVVQQAENIAARVASLLHFSKPDTGPLADADKWMPDFGDLLATGLNAQAGKIKGAALNIAANVVHATPTSAAIAQLAAPVATSTTDVTVALLTQILAELKSQTTKIGQGRATGGQSTIGHASPGTNLGTVRPQFGAASNATINSLYAQIDTLAGIAAINGSRGAVSGLGI